MIAFLLTGMVYGLSAGVSPGPLTALVFSQTLKHGVSEGAKVALSPLITDLPIILLTLFVLTQLANFKAILGLIGIAGSLYVLYLAYESFRAKTLAVDAGDVAPQSLSRGVIVNLLSPNPYLFWFGVGAPTMVKALADSPFSAAAFITGFYLFLVGTKACLALLVGRSRPWLLGNAYSIITRILGAILLVFAGILMRDSLQLLGVLK